MTASFGSTETLLLPMMLETAPFELFTSSCEIKAGDRARMCCIAPSGKSCAICRQMCARELVFASSNESDVYTFRLEIPAQL